MSGSRIDLAGQAEFVLAEAAAGKSSREIAAELSRRGVAVSHTTVSRWLKAETEERVAMRRAVGAQKATEVAALVVNDVQSNVALLREALPRFAEMVLGGYMTVAIPGAKPEHVPIEARDRVAAGKTMTALVKYLSDLASATPAAVDPTDKATILAILSEAYGYSRAADPNDPMYAPPTEEEWQPPVLD